MPVSISLEITAPAKIVWSILIDTDTWPVWGPSVTRVDCADRMIGPRSRGRVRTAAGIWLPFRIREFADGRYWSWKVAGIPATGHRVEPLGVDGCRLSFDVPVLAAPYLVVCTAACRRIRTMAEAAA